MCGIYFYGGKKGGYHYTKYEYLKENGNQCKHRGPDKSCELFINDSINEYFFLFHRLSINGLSKKGDQPFYKENIVLMCNGEIYNCKKLIDEYNLNKELLNQDRSDCEVIIDLYLKVGIEECIKKLDGVFSFILYDKTNDNIIIGHDPIGVRSLYWSYSKDELYVSSELKSLNNLETKVEMFPNGSYSIINLTNKSCNTTRYYDIKYPIKYFDERSIMENIKQKLNDSVKKRIMCQRGGISCLLSGGLDSSIITALMVENIGKIDTYSIGFKNSLDVLNSEIVAKHLKTNHTCLIVTEQEMLSAIEETIIQIESYDVTTIRASVPMFLLSKYISKNSESKVILSGEGADETSGSYLYFHNAPNSEEFKKECERLIQDNIYFDILRADKTTAGAGLELRVPFYDKEFVNYYMSIDPKLKMPRNKYEKYLLRKTFEDLLPKEIVWRRKDGFSDGVSTLEKPWYKTINEYTLKKFNLTEKQYYDNIFDKHYRKHRNTIPYRWMPKWCEETENPSGRLILS
jgi:asparagine synthase (glutamine-hydrolysing)